MASWTFRLEELIGEVVRTRGRGGASVIAELEAAALRAAHRLFGNSTPLAVRITDAFDVRVAQVLRVVDAPLDRRREIAAGAVRALGGELANVELGHEIQFPIAYTNEPQQRDEILRFQSIAAELPLPVKSPELWERMTEELNAVLLGYFPAPVFPPGSLGALLVGGGDWTRGIAARSGDLELIVESAFLDFYRLGVSGGYVEYGFETVIRKAGVEVFRGARGNTNRRLGEGHDAPYVSAIARSDNDGVVGIWAQLPTSADARPGFIEILDHAVADLAGGGELHGHNCSSWLLTAALAPPGPGGFWTWTQDALPRALSGHTHDVEHDGTTVRFEIAEVYPPAAGLISFGDAAVRVVARSPQLETSAEGELIMAGTAGPEALALRGPETGAERADLERVIATYRDWLDVHLDHHVATRGFEGIGFNYFYAFDGYFPLVDLLAQRLRLGPPGDPPVPAFDEAALERAGQLLAPIDGTGLGKSAAIVAAFSVAGWKIALLDDAVNGPFGSECGVVLVAPEGGEPTRVMMVDAWNPQNRLVVDGDAFAFRRFASWLRGAIVHGEHDVTLVFRPEADEDDDNDDNDEHEAASGDTELALSDWLLFGMPDTGDRFLVDWRAQWHVVNAGRPIESFAGIYGFSGEHIENLRTRDVPQWRRFLREVIDPRFNDRTLT